MELAKEKQIAQFTSPRQVRLVAPDGTMCINFEAGETLGVHRKMFGVAIAAGLIPEEPLEYQEPKPQEKKTREESVQEKLILACKELIIAGDPKRDFTKIGKPRAASIKKLVDFDFNGAELTRAFDQAMYEVDNNGGDSQEPSEPSSSNTQ